MPPELDASSPAATLGSFHAETRRAEALYETYNAAPTTAKQFAMADALQRIGAQLFDLSEIPPATRQKAGKVGLQSGSPACGLAGVGRSV